MSKSSDWARNLQPIEPGPEHHVITDLAARLGIDGVTFHDLRGTFITERKREGSTAEQIAGVTGHSISEINTVLERHYLADDQQASDAVILRMEKNTSRTTIRKRPVNGHIDA